MRVTNLTRRLASRLGREAKPQRVATGAAILAGGMMFTQTAEAQLFFEDFEDLPLQDTVTPAEAQGTAVWTDVAPAGWTRDNTTTPEGGPAEFFGWTFVDKEWWNDTAGQGRSEFTLGQGTVAVADGDEYDDTGIDASGVLGGSSQSMNVFLQTPAIDLTSSAPNSVQLSFDSSFRPYEAMTGLVDVSFDGGATFTNLLTIDTAAVPGGTSSFSRANEAVTLDLNNPAGASDAIVRFGYVNADNDWWWAIDNVGVGAPNQFAASLEVSPSGELLLANRTSQAIAIDYYEIESASESLSESGWTSLEAQGTVSGFEGGSGAGDGWEEGGNLGDGALSESLLTGFSVLEPGQTVSLGDGYDEIQDAEDLVFRYGAVPVGTAVLDATVGNYNGDSVVDDQDRVAWAAAFGTVGADLAADGNGDGVVDAADYTIWRDNLGLEGSTEVALGPSSLTEGFVNYLGTSSTAVPEPTALIACGAGLLAAGASRRRD